MSEPHLDLETKLRPLAHPLPPPRPGDWLAEHHEPGQTFAEYVDSKPVRKSDTLHAIYLCLIGDFAQAQRRVLARAEDDLALFFDCPVKVRRQIGLGSIPARARRTHPSWGDEQVLSGYVLHEVLEPERPADALAYLALTAAATRRRHRGRADRGVPRAATVQAGRLERDRDHGAGDRGDLRVQGERIGKPMKVPEKGTIGLQSEIGRFEFRHVRVKELP
jgi:hypothetical protein